MTYPQIKPLAFSPEDTAEIIGIGRTKLFSLLKSGELKSFKIGTRRLIKHSTIEEYLNQLENGAE